MKLHPQDARLHDAIAKLRAAVGEDAAAEIVAELMGRHQADRIISEIELIVSLRMEAQ